MTPLVTLLSLLALGAQAQHGAEWTYSEGALDEAHWPLEYPDCGGTRQSPIDLQVKKVRYNPSLRALNLTGYGLQHEEFPMTNNGHTGFPGGSVVKNPPVRLGRCGSLKARRAPVSPEAAQPQPLGESPPSEPDRVEALHVTADLTLEDNRRMIIMEKGPLPGPAAGLEAASGQGPSSAAAQTGDGPGVAGVCRVSA